MSQHEAAMMGRASQRGALGPGSRGAIEKTSSLGPAARGERAPLAIEGPKSSVPPSPGAPARVSHGPGHLPGYGGVAFSPTGGGIGNRRPGVAYISPANAAHRQRLIPEMLQHGRDADAFARRTGQGTPRVNRPVPLRTPPTADVGPRTPVMDTPTGGGRPPGPPRGVDRPVREAIEKEKGKLFKGKGRGLMIGAGAAVIAGLAYSGRRGEGSSGGRTSMGRY